MIPQYEKLKRYISKQIADGVWPEEHRVPSENQLTEQFNVSRMTANRALNELTSEGVLTRVVGVGTFVAEHIPQAPLFEIKNIAQEIRDRGHDYAAVVVSLGAETVHESLGLRFQTPPGARIFHSLVIHNENGIPVQLENRYVNPAVAPRYLEQDFTQVTPNEYLSAVAPITQAEHIIEAVLPSAPTRQLLSLDPGEPCLLLHRRTWTGEAVATIAELTHPGTRYRLGGRFTPDRAPLLKQASSGN